MLTAIKFTDLKAARRFRSTSGYSRGNPIIQHQSSGNYQICDAEIAKAFVKVGMAKIVVHGSVRI